MSRAIFGYAGLAWLMLACHQAPQPDNRARSAEPTSETPRKVAELRPELIAKADEILRANPKAEFGAEFPFELGGRKYVARVERHDNPDGDPDRPQGLHKGITVYSTD